MYKLELDIKSMSDKDKQYYYDWYRSHSFGDYEVFSNAGRHRYLIGEHLYEQGWRGVESGES